MPKGIYERKQFSLRKNSHGSTTEQFWLRVDKNGPASIDGSPCWSWIAGTNVDGYGQYRNKKAHRVSYLICIGEIPPGMMICHKCDNPSCVNPGHLFVGTAQDNMTDKMSKGRQGKSGTKTPPKGEKNVKAVLTESAVKYLRKKYFLDKKFNARKWGDIFGVARGTILSAVKGKTWSHI